MLGLVESQVAAGGSDGILDELASEQLTSLRDAIVALVAETRDAVGAPPVPPTLGFVYFRAFVKPSTLDKAFCTS